MTAPAAAVGAMTGSGAGGVGVAERSRVARTGGSAATEAMLQRFGGSAETWLALAVVVIVALLIVPLPPVLLDVLLATSLAISILVLLVTLSVSDPLEFSIFPSLLLLVTLLRLGLNVNATRLILSEGHAGAVIAARARELEVQVVRPAPFTPQVSLAERNRMLAELVTLWQSASARCPSKKSRDFLISRNSSTLVRAFRACSLSVWTTWPSVTVVTQAGMSLGAFSTSTRHIRQTAGEGSEGW